MNATAQHLERIFLDFIEETQPLSFFKGLAEYVDYVFAVPELKQVFAVQMEERNARYAEIQTLEEQAVAEVKAAAAKLVRVVEKKKIDVSTFDRFATMSLGQFDNILVELEALGTGGLYIAEHLSDSVEKYLFDIGANILALGNKKEVSGFVVSDNEYLDLHAQIDGRARSGIMGNIHGNFIFSRARIERAKLSALIETERELKSW